MTHTVTRSLQKFRTISDIIFRPRGFVLFVLLFFVNLALLMWALNFEFVWFAINTDAISAIEKLDFLSEILFSVIQNVDELNNLILVVFALLFALNIVLFLSLWGQIKSNRSKISSVAGGSLGLIAGGCVSCGASLLTPLLASFGSFSTATIHNVSSLFSVIGIILVLFSINQLVGLKTSP